MSLSLDKVLELYDSKITDLVNKRKPQGGFKSVLGLRDVLKNAALTPVQYKKFTECSTTLAELAQMAILKKTQGDQAIENVTQESQVQKVGTQQTQQFFAQDFIAGLDSITGDAFENSISSVEVTSNEENSQVDVVKPVEQKIEQTLDVEAVKPQSVPPVPPVPPISLSVPEDIDEGMGEARAEAVYNEAVNNVAVNDVVVNDVVVNDNIDLVDDFTFIDNFDKITEAELQPNHAFVQSDLIKDKTENIREDLSVDFDVEFDHEHELDNEFEIDFDNDDSQIGSSEIFDAETNNSLDGYSVLHENQLDNDGVFDVLNVVAGDGLAPVLPVTSSNIGQEKQVLESKSVEGINNVNNVPNSYLENLADAQQAVEQEDHSERPENLQSTFELEFDDGLTKSDLIQSPEDVIDISDLEIEEKKPEDQSLLGKVEQDAVNPVDNFMLLEDFSLDAATEDSHGLDNLGSDSTNQQDKSIETLEAFATKATNKANTKEDDVSGLVPLGDSRDVNTDNTPDKILEKLAKNSDDDFIRLDDSGLDRADEQVDINFAAEEKTHSFEALESFKENVISTDLNQDVDLKTAKPQEKLDDNSNDDFIVLDDFSLDEASEENHDTTRQQLDQSVDPVALAEFFDDSEKMADIAIPSFKESAESSEEGNANFSSSNVSDDLILVDDFDLNNQQQAQSKQTLNKTELNKIELKKAELKKTELNKTIEIGIDSDKSESALPSPEDSSDNHFDGIIDLDDEDDVEQAEALTGTTMESGMLDMGDTHMDFQVDSIKLVQSAVEEDVISFDDNVQDSDIVESSTPLVNLDFSEITANQATQIPSEKSKNMLDDDAFILIDDDEGDVNGVAQPQVEQTNLDVDSADDSQIVLMPSQIMNQNQEADVVLQADQVDVKQSKEYKQEDDFDDSALMVSGDGFFDADFSKTLSSDTSELEHAVVEQKSSAQEKLDVTSSQNSQSKKTESFDFSINQDDISMVETQGSEVQGSDIQDNLTLSIDQTKLDAGQDIGQDTDENADPFGALGSMIMGAENETVKEHRFSTLPTSKRPSPNFDIVPNELNDVAESISDTQLAEEEEELEHIRALAVKVWLYDLRRELDKLSFSFRFEPGRNTVRLIYSVMRNLQRYSTTPDFADDVELQHFNVIEAFPDYDNPLVPLRRLEDIRAVTDVFVQTIFSFKTRSSQYKHLKIPQEGVLAYLKKFAYLVAEDPYAGKMSLIENKHPEIQRIKDAILMVEMDDIGYEAKRIERARLEKKLAHAMAVEEANSSMFKQDVKVYQDAVTNLFRWLYILLPSHVGGRATLPKLEGDIIAAKNTSLKRYKQAKDSDAITLQLSGPVKCHLDSLEVAVIKTGNVWDLYCGEESSELSELTLIEASGRQIEAFVSSDYLHLRVANKSRNLPQLLSEGLLLHWMITEGVFDKFAAVLKLITNINAATSQLHMIRAIRQFIKLCEQSQNSLQAMMGFVNAAKKSLGSSLSVEVLNQFFQKIEVLLEARGSRLSKVLEFFGLEESNLSLKEIMEESQTMQFSGKAFKIRKLGGYGDSENLLHTGFAMRTAAQLESDEMLLFSTPDGPTFVLDELSLYDIKRGYVLFAQSGMQVAGIFLPNKKKTVNEEEYM